MSHTRASVIGALLVLKQASLWSVSRNVAALLIVALLSFIWLNELGERRHLANPDEGRYAEIPREMVATGDWITPRLNGLKYFEKPPMQYWATACAFRLFGDQEWVTRLWPLLTGFVGLLACLYTAWRLYGRTVAFIAFSVLASALIYVMFAFIVTLDMGLTVFLTLSLLAFVLAQQSEASQDVRRGWMLAVWAMMGCAVLSKGVVGVILPGLVLAAYVLASRDWRLLGRLHALLGLLVLSAIVVPWFVAIQLRNPEFFQFFFAQEHINRFFSPDHHRTGAPGYFFAVLGVGFMPWTPLLLLALGERLRRWRTFFAPCAGGLDTDRILWLWVAVIFVFFSLSSSKLPAYILPIFPPLALLLAPFVSRLRPRVLAAAIAVNVPLVLAIAAASPALRAWALAHYPGEVVYAYWPWLQSSLWWFGGGTVMAALLAWRGARIVSLGVLALSSLHAWDRGVDGMDALSTSISSAPLIQRAQEAAGPFNAETPFFSVGMYDQTLPFYLKRTVTLVAYRDELAMGLNLEPQQGIASTAAFRERWDALPHAYAILPLALFRKLRADGLMARELQHDDKKIIVAKP